MKRLGFKTPNRPSLSDQHGGELGSRVTVSVKFSSLAEVSSRLIQPAAMLVLARLLTPSDFGLAGTAAGVIALGRILGEAGLGNSLIQSNEDTERAANVVFWSNIVLACSVYALVFLAAPTIAVVFDDLRVGPVIRISGIQLVITSVGAVQGALFRRALDYRPIFWGRVASVLLPSLASVPMAAAGYGVWALVAGTIVGTTAQVAILWIHSSWRPRIAYDKRIAAGLVPFGAWLTAEALLAWFYSWADSMIMGASLGVKELGLFRTGSTIVFLVFGLGLAPLLPVFYSTFCRIQGDPPKFSVAMAKAVRVGSTITLPIMIGLPCVGNLGAQVLFGHTWEGLGQVISMVGLYQGWSWYMTGVMGEAYRATGRPDILPKLMLFELLYYLPTYWYVVPLGLYPFLVARTVLGFISLPLHLWLMVRVLHVHPLFLWRQSRVAWLAASIMGGSLLVGLPAIESMVPNSAGQPIVLFAAVGLGAGVHTGIIVLADYPFVREMAGLLRKAAVG